MHELSIREHRQKVIAKGQAPSLGPAPACAIGILGMLLAIGGFYGVGPFMGTILMVLQSGVEIMINAHLLPTLAIFIEPAKVLFLNGVQRSADYARLLLAEYARCTSTMSSLNAIRGNIAKHGYEVSRPTADAYLVAMRRLYVIEDLRPWFPSLRARSRVASTPGRFLADPSIAAAALGADDGALLKDLSTLETLFRSLCIRDLRVYAESLGGELYRYHDNTGLEADAVMTLRGGRYALMEVKLGASEVDGGARSLLNLAHKIDQGTMGTPSFCAVITPGGYAYKRSDGVLVLPITCLMP